MRIIFDSPNVIMKSSVSDTFEATRKLTFRSLEFYSVVLAVGLYVGGYIVWPVAVNLDDVMASPLGHAVSFLSIVALTIFAHELLHLVAFPGGVVSKRNYLGVHIKGLIAFAHTSHQMGKYRFLYAKTLPFFVLSVIPGLFEIFYDLPSGWFGLVVVVNASISSNDILISALVAHLVPNDAFAVRSNINYVEFSAT